MASIPDISIAATPEKAGLVVLQVLPALVTGGVERGTVDIAQAIVAAGGTALVASAGGPMMNEIERAGAIHIKMPADAKNPLTMWRNVRRLTDIVREHRVDILHARSRAPAWSARAAARRAGIPFVTTFHGNYGAANAIKRTYNSIMTRGDRVIAISDFIGEHIVTVYGVDADRVRVIPRGVDVALFDPAAVTGQRVIQLSEQWRVPDDAKVIMLPGRLTRWKGQLVLIEALARLGDHADLRCILVGSEQGRSGYVEELKTEIARRGLESMVHIAGESRDMPAAFMLADVVVSASTEAEGFGRVIAEALAMGRPVIATDHGGARETVIPGKTGWLVPPGDASALAEALRDALAMDRWARESLAARAIRHVRTDYTKEMMSARTLALYHELLAEWRARVSATPGHGSG